MDDDLDLRHFANVCRLFPLPGVVMFPHAVLPLHIFEPRYRQMTRDALNGDKLVTVVQLLPKPDASDPDPPPLETVGCLGRIIRHEALPDGRFNFLLLGRKRVRLRRELATDTMYRMAEVEVLDDLDEPSPAGPVRDEFRALFRRAFEGPLGLDPDLAKVIDSDLPLGVLTDIVAHALGLPAEIKQALLDEPRVARRVDGLREVFRRLLGASEGGEAPAARPFPPPFSPN